MKQIFRTVCMAALTAAFIAGCTKIDTTTLGQDLIPPIDGVTTLATDTFGISTELGIFNDSTLLLKNDDHFLGQLTGDPRFGNTNASIYLQFKPLLQFAWKNKKDSIISLSNDGFDSAVLCLAYNENIYGDSLSTLGLDVFKIDDTTNFSQTKFYPVAANPNVSHSQLFSSNFSITPASLAKDTLISVLKRDTVRHTKMLRIKLSSPDAVTFFKEFLRQDTTATSAFNSNTNFTKFMKGFVIKPRGNSGRAIMNFSLIGANTRLEVWYRYLNNGVPDTTVASFGFNQFPTQEYRCASINHIDRQTGGSQMQQYAQPGVDSLLYLYATPGSYAVVKFPTIKNFPNKLIHRAELIFEEDAAFKNSVYEPPGRLYLDAVVTNFSKFRSIPTDFYLTDPFSGPADFAYFGGDRRTATDAAGNAVSRYTFNVTKYVQGMISRAQPYYDLRLYCPFDTRYYSQQDNTYYDNGGIAFPWPVVNRAAAGAVVLGGGSHSRVRVKLRLVYSNI